MAKHSEKTVTVIFQQHPDDPGVALRVTPAAASVMRAMEAMKAEERQGVLRVLRAIKAGQFNYSASEIAAWAPEQLRAVVDSLPEVRS